MLFHECYSAYYHAVAMILRECQRGEVRDERMRQIIAQCAFPESHLEILPALRQGKWPLIGKSGSVLRHSPDRPMTLLEKRFLKTLLDDPRIRLFGLRFGGLEEVEPLFDASNFVIYDRCLDGDPYLSERYVETFALIRRAIREQFPLKIEVETRKGACSTKIVMPKKLEYSEKDDKFRLYTTGCRYGQVINLGRIRHCQRYVGRPFSPHELTEPAMHRVILSITDERDALSRTAHHFAHFEMEIEKTDENRYRMMLYYDPSDESELVIRILTFGPMVKVEGPWRMVELVRERVDKQMKFHL